MQECKESEQRGNGSADSVTEAPGIPSGTNADVTTPSQTPAFTNRTDPVIGSTETSGDPSVANSADVTTLRQIPPLTNPIDGRYPQEQDMCDSEANASTGTGSAPRRNSGASLWSATTDEGYAATTATTAEEAPVVSSDADPEETARTATGSATTCDSLSSLESDQRLLHHVQPIRHPSCDSIDTGSTQPGSDDENELSKLPARVRNLEGIGGLNLHLQTERTSPIPEAPTPTSSEDRSTPVT